MKLARWIWYSRSVPGRLVRLVLLPLAVLYRAAMLIRNGAYGLGLLKSAPLPRPAIGVGNLAVGGTGKSPLSAWLAAELKRRGLTAGIVLRGYGADEVAEHRLLNPDAAVEADPDRHAAAGRAAQRGAEVLVLDDILQRRDTPTDVMLAVVSADTWTAPRWSLPAGPWREGLAALRRADAVVVTRKAASRDAADNLRRLLAPRTRGGAGVTAAIEPASLARLDDGSVLDLAMLAGREVLAVAGIGEPQLFAEQLRRLGARVELVAFTDHYRYAAEDVTRISSQAAGRWVVSTLKDAVKLRALWTADAPACYVVRIGVTIEAGADTLAGLLDRVATAARTDNNPEAAAASPARKS